MRAVVRRGTRLVFDEIADPTPGPGQTLVRTLCCGICGSDLHALHHFEHMVALSKRAGGGWTDVDPAQDVVFGHEFCAEILEHGPGTAGRFKPGTHVVSIPVVLEERGAEVIGYSHRLPGGFAERMVLSEMLLLEVPNGLSNQQAAMTEPFSVGAHAVAMAAMDQDSVALVVGCGPVGLAVIASLKAKGFGPVIAADFSPARRNMAERLGADIVVDPAAQSPHTRWSELGVPATGLERQLAMMSGGSSKKPVIFECVGVRGVLQSLIEAAPPMARILVAGVCMQRDEIEPFLAIVKQLELKFVYGYTPDEFAATLRDIADGRIDAQPLITSVVGLSGVARAFETLANPQAEIKIVVDPNLAGVEHGTVR
ncbi:MAG TPA: zinc-binding dehydrogenase [Steroidobacteraceae bacterium]|nr:zinc-binding dehydrogenase [Steroidobacteraceae bacterium]